MISATNNNPIEVFRFRPATGEEIKANTSGTMKWLTEKAQAVFNSACLARVGGDLYRFFGTPIPQGTPCKILRTTTGWNWYVFSSPEMFRSIANEHRNHEEGFFKNDMAAKTLLEIGSEIFLKGLKDEDTISTCTKENSKKYRAIVARHLGSAMIKPRLFEIDEMAGQLLNEIKVQPEQEVNVTELCQKLVSVVINRFLLGLNETDSLAVAKAIVAANAYILAKATGSANKEEFAKHAEVLRMAIDRALANDTPFVRELHSMDLTEIQKKVLIIVVYFTGLGGTISQMGGLMWHLSKHPEYQKELFVETMAEQASQKPFPFTAQLIKESFRVHPSTLTIDRPTGKPLMLDYEFGNIRQTVYIPEKSIITLYQPWAAEQCQNPKEFNPHRQDPVELYPFGHGVHKCVGQFISEELLGRFARVFTRRFQYSSPLSELPVQGYFNLEPQKDVTVLVQPRINI